jgi:hypothetical protein
MITTQFNDIEYYNKIVKDEQIAYSIEGFLGLVLKLRENNNKKENFIEEAYKLFIN